MDDDDFEEKTGGDGFEENAEGDFDVDDWEYSEGFEAPAVAPTVAPSAPAPQTMDDLAALARRYNRRLRLDKKEAAVILSHLKPDERALYVARADADIDGEFRNITLVLTRSRFFYLTDQRRFYSCSKDSFTTIWCDYMYTKSVPLEKVTGVEYENYGDSKAAHFLKIETADSKCYELQMPSYLFSKSSAGLDAEILKIFSSAVEGRKEDARRLKKPGSDE